MTPPEEPAGAALHYRALERLYGAAPVNALFPSRLEITGEGRSRLTFTIEPGVYHAAGAAHGTIYFKMLDDAAFYAANTLVTDRFLLTTSFNLHFTKPVRAGEVVAEGRWISGRKRVDFMEISSRRAIRLAIAAPPRLVQPCPAWYRPPSERK